MTVHWRRLSRSDCIGHRWVIGFYCWWWGLAVVREYWGFRVKVGLWECCFHSEGDG